MNNNPIDVLRTGIKTASWTDVCEGFRLLTGENLEVPHTDTVAEEVLYVIGSLLQQYFNPVQDEADLDFEVEPIPKKESRRQRPRMEWELEPEAAPDIADEVSNEPEPAPEPEASDKPESAGPDEERARQLRDERERPTAADFSIEHQGEESGDDKGKRCKTLPMDIGPIKNRFADNRKLAADTIPESCKLSKGFEGKDHREEFEPVPVTCSRCGKAEKVHPDNAPKKLDKGDGVTAYICNRCVVSGRKY